jgi:hypothetical protein
VFDDFCNANDPHGERDFGAFDADGHTLFSRLTIMPTTSPTRRPIRQIQT